MLLLIKVSAKLGEFIRNNISILSFPGINLASSVMNLTQDVQIVTFYVIFSLLLKTNGDGNDKYAVTNDNAINCVTAGDDGHDHDHND